MTTEIEKLERRWQENPNGLTFAPLAEAYRKNGALERALELLDTGLAHHPGYVPAHIVRGRCHLDSGERALAELDFLCVAELDPENVIALKALADLAEEEGRTSDAIRRLESLLEIDRNNDEAESQLLRLRGEAPAGMLTGGEFAVRDDAVTLTPASERLDGIQVLGGDSGLPSVASAMVRDPEPLAPSPGGSEPVAAEQTGSGTLAGLPEEVHAWLAASLEASPDAAADVRVDGRADEPAPSPPPEPAAAAAAAPEGKEESEAPEPDRNEENQAAEPEEKEEKEAAEPDLMVTETMAEIFLRQGHRELALAVYTQLLQREPRNERVKAAAEELSRSLAPEPAPPEPAPVPPPRRHDAASTGGRPVQEFLGTILSAGRPRPAHPLHPPAFDRRSEPRSESAPAEPSFDEFFASEEPVAPASSPMAADVPEGSEESPRATDPEELEQFHAWLRGLQT